MIKNIGLFLLFLVIVPANVKGECTCEPEDELDRDKSEALKYKIVGISSILAAGAIGVGLPFLGKVVPSLQPETNTFFMVKAFAAGVILSTAFIHVFPDAFENLMSPCLNENPWGNFPFTGFMAMVSAIGTLMVDCFATSYYSNKRKNEVNEEKEGDEEKSGQVDVHTHATHGHSHGLVDSNPSQLLRHRVIAQVLELGIVAHSRIIGISLGASQSQGRPATIKPLIAALNFHQFFEGMGLGGCITQAKFKGRVMLMMRLFFSLTTPLGIAIGIGISEGYNENSPTALIVEGIFDAASAGILIYMSLVDLLAADFMHPKVQSSGKLQFGVNFVLLLGAAFMSILAKWA